MLSENRKLVYAGNKYNEIHYRSLPKIHFTASGFFLKMFDRLCVFVCFFLVFKHIIVSKFFRLSREKSAKSMCYLKIYIKVYMYLMHKTNHT